MQIILQEKVVNLGNVGDQVKVKPGYARNFLIPFGKAVPATEKYIAQFEERRADLEKLAQKQLETAQKRAEKLKELSVTIKAQAGDEGKLFGSIGPRDIAEAITQAGVEVEKREVHLAEGPIRQIGEYEVFLQLHSDVDTTIKVVVEAV